MTATPRPRLALLALCCVALASGCATPSPPGAAQMTSPSPPAPDVASAAHPTQVAAWDAWRASRDQSLRSPDGWLTLIGLFWLEGGPERVGAAADSEILLLSDAAPDLLGTLYPNGQSSPRFVAAPGQALTLSDGSPAPAELVLETDASGSATAPTVLHHKTLSMHVIQRGDRMALRVKDSASHVLRDFPGVSYFPFDPSLQVRATLDAYPAPQLLDVPTAIGTVEPQPSPGVLRFTLDGQALALHPVGEVTDDALFVIFADATSGAQTYGAGRFLTAERTPDGAYLLDFNRAYSPPCAFTPYATCPRPPQENRLPVPIHAGEQALASH
jgi:uncharacterized protein